MTAVAVADPAWRSSVVGPAICLQAIVRAPLPARATIVSCTVSEADADTSARPPRRMRGPFATVAAASAAPDRCAASPEAALLALACARARSAARCRARAAFRPVFGEYHRHQVVRHLPFQQIDFGRCIERKVVD